MKSALLRLSQFIHPKNSWQIITIAIVFKLIQALVFGSWSNELSPDLMVDEFILKHPDYNYYLQPVDRFFEEGTYYYIEGQCFAGRMPGYWGPYGLFRSVLPQKAALYALIGLQIFLSGLAVFVIALLSKRIFKNDGVFIWTYLLFLFSSFTSVFDFQSIAESLSVPTFIFSLFYFIKYWQDDPKKAKNLLLSGFFITWTIFLRPYAGVFLLILGLFVLWKEGFKIKNLVTSMLFFALPFVVIEGAWIIRNYKSCGDIILLQQNTAEAYGKNYSDGWIAARTLIHAWGEGGEYFESGTAASWFKLRDEKLTDQLKNEYFDGVEYTKEDIIELKAKYQEYFYFQSDNIALDKEIIQLSQEYTRQFKEAHPWRYYVTQRWNAFKRLIFHSGSSYVPLPSFSEMSLIQKVLKLFYSGIYYLVLILGFIGILLSVIDRKIKLLLVLILISLILALVYLSTIQEARYFIMGYAVLILFAGGLLSKIQNVVNSKT